MKDYGRENLCSDPIHGYMPFVAAAGLPDDEVSEEQIVDHPWVQRLRQIHQLQTAWWVFPTAEHTRFQHVLGAMHLASRAAEALYESLQSVCPDVPSRGYVETLLRMAALLHDVGHGPFGHFFDDHFLARFELTHETLGCEILRRELAPLLTLVRRNPGSELGADERLDAEQICALIKRPRGDDAAELPRWLVLLRSLFSGLYTVDNMDYVLRDAYMSGFSSSAFDLERLLHYSFFTESGLTIHERGLSALVRFLEVRAELFRTLYFHREVRSIDLTLADLFAKSGNLLFDGNPLEHLDAYQRFTEWTLLNDVATWTESDDPARRALGGEWQAFLRRKLPWRMVCERTRFFRPGEAEQTTIFASEARFLQALAEQLPESLDDTSLLRVDLPRHIHRPGTRGPAGGQNFLYEAARGHVRALTDSEVFRQLPLSYRLCRVYTRADGHEATIAAAVDELIRPERADDITNM